MTTSSVSVSTETFKQLNCLNDCDFVYINTGIDEFRDLLNSSTSMVAETKHEPNLVIKYYDTEKTKKSQEFYILNGDIHGKFKEYYRSSGKIYCEINYVNGKKHNTAIYYNQSGAIQSVRKYENGILMSEINM